MRMFFINLDEVIAAVSVVIICLGAQFLFIAMNYYLNAFICDLFLLFKSLESHSANQHKSKIEFVRVIDFHTFIMR